MHFRMKATIQKFISNVNKKVFILHKTAVSGIRGIRSKARYSFNPGFGSWRHPSFSPIAVFLLL